MHCLAPAGVSNTSKWKQSVPDCIALSSCLIDSSSVVTRSDWPGECTLSPCDWPVSVRAGGSCSRGATRPGPGTQGRFKAIINIHEYMSGSAVHTWITCCVSTFLGCTLTFTSDEQGQLSGVRLSAGSYEHDNLVMCVFRNVSTVDEDHQVSLQEFGFTSTCLQTTWRHLKPDATCHSSPSTDVNFSVVKYTYRSTHTHTHTFI